jgi:hypothetical protein
VLDEIVEDAGEVSTVPDEDPVAEFVADRADPSLRVRVREGCPRRDADDIGTFGGEGAVERAGELFSSSSHHRVGRQPAGTAS